jgi:hypothetical protein
MIDAEIRSRGDEEQRGHRLLLSWVRYYKAAQ